MCCGKCNTIINGGKDILRYKYPSFYTGFGLQTVRGGGGGGYGNDRFGFHLRSLVFEDGKNGFGLQLHSVDFGAASMGWAFFFILLLLELAIMVSAFVTICFAYVHYN